MNALDILKMGYTDLVPVIPPGAPLSPHSKIRPEDRGKVPGVMNGDGTWHGINWRALSPTTESDVARWGHMGANIGLRAAYFPAVDIDCTDPALAGVIEQLAVQHLGVAPKRVGRAPKALLVYRTKQPFGRMRLWIGEHLIEVLGDGQQYVVQGIHPVTGKPYEWPWGLVAADDLIEITRDDADAFLTAAQETLEAFGYACRREGHGGLAIDRQTIDQEALAGDAAQVQAALALIPNDNEHFPGRDDYLRMGYAIKAALGEAGYPLFEEWALKWEGNDQYDGNDPETVRADWLRMKPPFEVGAPWIFETATEFGYDWAADEFEAEADLPAPGDDDCGEFATEENVTEEADERDAPTKNAAYSDRALRAAFLKRYADRVRHCEQLGGWLSWDGTRWARGGDKMVRHWVGNICGKAAERAMDDPNLTPAESAKLATKLGSNAVKNAVTDYTKDHPAVSVDVRQLDTHNMLFNSPAGMTDLMSAALLAHSKEKLMTRSMTVSPQEGPAPVWDRFMHDLTNGDKDLEAYLYRYLGYALTGDKREHVIVFLYGLGGNGKSTFLDVVTNIWGDYAVRADMSLFMEQRYESHPTGLADLEGVRLIISEETQAGRNWNEALLKQLSSGGKIKARRMRQDFFEFEPKGKLLFAGNNKPSIRNLDDALRRRFQIVPLMNKPATPDPLLPEKLKAEYPQILHRFVQGCLDWQRQGLNPPKVVVDETNSYFADENPVGDWIAARIIRTNDPNDFAATKDLFDDWNEFAGTLGMRAYDARWLGRMMTNSGFTATRKNDKARTRGFAGLKLIPRVPGDEFQTV